MADGAHKGQKKSRKGRSDGGPTQRGRLNGPDKTPPENGGGTLEDQVARADAIIHSSVVDKFRNEPAYPHRTRHEWTDVQLAAARLYSQGYTRAQVARGLVDYITPAGKDAKGYERTKEKRLTTTRATLRRWEMEQWFRDKVYELAVVKTDMAIPQIMEGIVRKAKRGRVDAAKLALQVAGRIGAEEAGGGSVTVVFGADIPRPKNRGVVHAEEEVEDADYEVLE